MRERIDENLLMFLLIKLDYNAFVILAKIRETKLILTTK